MQSVTHRASRRPRASAAPATAPAPGQKSGSALPVSTILKVLDRSGVRLGAAAADPEPPPADRLAVLAVTLWPLVGSAGAARPLAFRSSVAPRRVAGSLAVIALFVFLILPPLATQTIELAENIGAYRRNVQAHLGPDHPDPGAPDVGGLRPAVLARGREFAQASAGLGPDGRSKSSLAAVLVLVLSLYLLLDGKRTYAWLLAYVPRRHRAEDGGDRPRRLRGRHGVRAGPALTSLLAGAYAFAVLTVLRVPSALPLAVLAAICDVLPILGVFVSTIPAAFFALTVSPFAAAAVVVLYLLYHALENYVIIPRVYGRQAPALAARRADRADRGRQPLRRPGRGADPADLRGLSDHREDLALRLPERRGRRGPRGARGGGGVRARTGRSTRSSRARSTPRSASRPCENG